MVRLALALLATGITVLRLLFCFAHGFNPIRRSRGVTVLHGNPAHFALSCRMLPRDCQMLLFSATFEDSVWKFAQKVVPDPNIIKLKREEETLDTIKQYYVLCSNRDEKFQALCNIYGAITIAQAMIFCHVSPFRECQSQ